MSPTKNHPPTTPSVHITALPPLPSSIPTTPSFLHTPADIAVAIPPLLNWPPSPPPTISVIPGGITNQIYKAIIPHHPPVLIRIFGAPDIFPLAARANETAVFAQLATAALAPALLAAFANGRVEAFLPARTLTLHQMTSASICVPLARALARLHAFVPSTNMPTDQPHHTRHPALFPQLMEWATYIERQHLPAPKFDRCKRALSRLQAFVEERNPRVVFAHNDLLAGNILVDDQNKVTLIDFEYASWNFRAFDVANFFAECMGGTQDGVVRPQLYPTPEFRRAFCHAYLEESAGTKVSETEIEALLKEVAIFDPLTHLYWGLWAVVQSEGSVIDFPYMKFAEQRLEQCFDRCGFVSTD